MMNRFVFVFTILLPFSLLADKSGEVRSQNVSGEKSSEVRDCLDLKLILTNFSYDYIDLNDDPKKCMLEQNKIVANKTSILKHLQKKIPESLYNFSSYIKGWAPSPQNQKRSRIRNDQLSTYGNTPEFGDYKIRESDEEKMFGELLRLKNINILLKSYMFANRKHFDLASKIDTNICPKGIIDGIKIKSKQQKNLFDSKGLKLRDNFKMSLGFRNDIISAARELKKLIKDYNYFIQEAKCKTYNVDLSSGIPETICFPRDKAQANYLSRIIKKKLQKYPSLLLDRKTGFWSSDKVWEDQPWIDKVANLKPEGKEIIDFILLANEKMNKKVIDTIHRLCMTPQEEKSKRLNSPDRELNVKAFKSHELVSISPTVDELLREFPNKVFKFKEIKRCINEQRSSDESWRQWKVLGTGVGCGILSGAIIYSGVGIPLIGSVVGACTIADIGIAIDNYNYFEESYTKVEGCSKAGVCSVNLYDDTIKSYNNSLNDIYYSFGAMVVGEAAGIFLNKINKLKNNIKAFEKGLKSVPPEVAQRFGADLERVRNLPKANSLQEMEHLIVDFREIRNLTALKSLDPDTLDSDSVRMISEYFEIPDKELLRILKEEAKDPEVNLYDFIKNNSKHYKEFKEEFEGFAKVEMRDRLLRSTASESEVIRILRGAAPYAPKDDSFRMAESILSGNKSYEEILLDSSRIAAERYGYSVEVNSLAKILRDHPAHKEKILELLKNGTVAQKQFVKDLYTGKPKNYSEAYMKRFMDYVTNNYENKISNIEIIDNSIIVLDNNIYGDLLPGQDSTKIAIIEHFIGERMAVSPPSILREETNISSRLKGLLPTPHSEEFYKTVQILEEMGIGEGPSSRYHMKGNNKGFEKDGLYDQRAMAEVLHSNRGEGLTPIFMTSDQAYLKAYLKDRVYREISQDREFARMLYGAEIIPKKVTKSDWMDRIENCISNGCKGSAHYFSQRGAREYKKSFGGHEFPAREFYVRLDEMIRKDMQFAGMSPAEAQRNLKVYNGKNNVNFLTRYPCGLLVNIAGKFMNLVTVDVNGDLGFIKDACK
jgi:hypothetical protein